MLCWYILTIFPYYFNLWVSKWASSDVWTVHTFMGPTTEMPRGTGIFIMATIRRDQIQPDPGARQVSFTACKFMTSLNPDVWCHILASMHPEHNRKKFLTEGITKGFWVGFKYQYTTINDHICKKGLTHASNFSNLRPCNSAWIWPTALKFGSRTVLS